MPDPELQKILLELQAREPIFHRRQFGTSREDLERMTDEDFWEIGASGKTYSREYAISNLLKRYEQPEPHDWPCRDFSVRQLAPSLYMINYLLEEPERLTRRQRSGEGRATAGRSYSIKERSSLEGRLPPLAQAERCARPRDLPCEKLLYDPFIRTGRPAIIERIYIRQISRRSGIRARST
jgi:hypothetical protein